MSIQVTPEFSFKHTRCVQPHINANLTITTNIRQFIDTDFVISHDLLQQIDDGFDKGDILADAWVAEARTLDA